eukprot:CAMPEP_0174704324 /NCGR_PEP_ID=MMETSP1094-20130205/7967_1 /TAXON_ID=156173 /ORGANISM="Chrysochromulina brevifilum, Strain UTEX LB 985" /LENGTH=46 /DNA_ID= /DNA_START= /DNA_END= /DNA_ORIENTATION=
MPRKKTTNLAKKETVDDEALLNEAIAEANAERQKTQYESDPAPQKP